MSSEKIDFIRSNINLIPVDGRRHVLRTLLNSRAHLINPTAKGVVFDADKMTAEEVDKMYDVLTFYIQKKY